MATKKESADKPKRQLLEKGPLKPPRPRPPGASITQDRPSKDEVTIGAKRCRHGRRDFRFPRADGHAPCSGTQSHIPGRADVPTLCQSG